MIMKTEALADTAAGEVVVNAWEHARLGGWEGPEVASRELRRKAAWLDPEPLICGGYETRKAHPETGLRERITFWPDRTA